VSPLLLGHRGDPEHHPENSLQGFRAAVACGAQGVELDVHASADGELVVIHDDTLDRTTPARGRVDAHTWPQLEGLLPRLGDVLDALRGSVVAVELKPEYDLRPGLAAAVLDLARRLDVAAGLRLLAFDHRHLAAARRHDSSAQCVALVREAPADPVAVAGDCGGSALGAWWQHVDRTMCESLHAAGLAMVAWTVDAEADARRLGDLGVDVLISNRPCALARVLR
jgi:glycerophosphoryl diester phosphodiesterase